MAKSVFNADNMERFDSLSSIKDRVGKLDPMGDSILELEWLCNKALEFVTDEQNSQNLQRTLEKEIRFAKEEDVNEDRVLHFKLAKQQVLSSLV